MIKRLMLVVDVYKKKQARTKMIEQKREEELMSYTTKMGDYIDLEMEHIREMNSQELMFAISEISKLVSSSLSETYWDRPKWEPNKRFKQIECKLLRVSTLAAKELLLRDIIKGEE